MNDILECVRKDEMLAQIFKKFLSIVSPVYFRIQNLIFQGKKNRKGKSQSLSSNHELRSDPLAKAHSLDISTSIHLIRSFNLK